MYHLQQSSTSLIFSSTVDFWGRRGVTYNYVLLAHWNHFCAFNLVDCSSLLLFIWWSLLYLSTSAVHFTWVIHKLKDILYVTYATKYTVRTLPLRNCNLSCSLLIYNCVKGERISIVQHCKDLISEHRVSKHWTHERLINVSYFYCFHHPHHHS